MRSKAPLALMEQLIMVAVFALAAAVCVQAFTLSGRISKDAAAKDRAVIEAQTAAETLKNCGGDLSKTAQTLGGETSGSDRLTVWYDDSWQTVDGSQNAAYRLEGQILLNGNLLMECGEIQIYTADGTKAIYSLNTAWQWTDTRGEAAS